VLNCRSACICKIVLGLWLNWIIIIKKLKKNSFCHSFSTMGISHFCNRYKETADLLVGHKNCLELSLAILARNASLRKQLTSNLWCCYTEWIQLRVLSVLQHSGQKCRVEITGCCWLLYLGCSSVSNQSAQNVYLFEIYANFSLSPMMLKFLQILNQNLLKLLMAIWVF